MRIGIITYRKDTFATVIEEINIKGEQEHGSDFRQTLEFIFFQGAEFLEENKILYEIHLFIFDLDFLDSFSKEKVTGLIRLCRRQQLEYIIGAPEYPVRTADEVMQLIRLKRLTSARAGTFNRVYDKTEFVFKAPEKTPLEMSPDVLRVGIIGNGRCVGTSFVTLAIAKELTSGKRKKRDFVSVIGVEDTYYFDSLGMENRFKGRDFFDFFSAVKEKKKIKGEKNIDEKINWVVKTPVSGDESLELEEASRLLYRSGGSVVLWDFSGDRSLPLQMQLLREVDRIVFVIDPLPSKLLDSHWLLEQIRNMDIPILYVINKYNKGVNKKELLRYLKIKTPVFLPWIDGNFFYEAEYHCKVLYNSPEVKKICGQSISRIAISLTDQDRGFSRLKSG